MKHAVISGLLVLSHFASALAQDSQWDQLRSTTGIYPGKTIAEAMDLTAKKPGFSPCRTVAASLEQELCNDNKSCTARVQQLGRQCVAERESNAPALAKAKQEEDAAWEVRKRQMEQAYAAEKAARAESAGGGTGGGGSASTTGASSGSSSGSQRGAGSLASSTSKTCGDVFSAAAGVMQTDLSKLPREGYSPRILEHMVAVQLWRQSTLRAFGPCSSDGATMSNQDDIVKRAIQSCRGGGGSNCDSGHLLGSSSSQLSAALSSALAGSSSSAGAGCRTAYRELQSQFKSAPAQQNSIPSLQILMWMASESTKLANGACRGQPEQSELSSFGPQYESALRACRGIASNEAICVPKSPAQALAADAPRRSVATSQSNSGQSAPARQAPESRPTRACYPNCTAR